MIGDTFKNLKNSYTEIKIPDAEIDKKWQMLSDILPEQDMSRTSFHFMPYGAVFLSAVLVLFIATIGLAQAAKPGSFLYPVNFITQEVAKKITNTFQPESTTMTPPNVSSSAGVMRKIPTPTHKPILTPTSYPTEKENEPSVFEKAHTKIVPTMQVLGSQTKDDDQTSTQVPSHDNSDKASSNSQKANNAANNNQSENSHVNNNNTSNGNRNSKKN